MGKGKRKVGSKSIRANDVCMHCRKEDHWKIEFPKLLSNAGTFVIEVNMITNFASWLLDTGRGAHICNDLQVLERSRKLSRDKVVLKLGDGKAIAAQSAAIVHLAYGYVYLMRYNSEAFGRFKEFRLEVENQTGRKIKALQLDRGEFYRTALILLGYALETATKLLNMEPTYTMAETPYLIWHNKPASYNYLGVWGSPAYVKRLVGDKVDLRSSLCRFVAMSDIDSGKWIEAMKNSEMCSMSSNKVWTLVDPPKGVKPVECNGSTNISLELTGRLLLSRPGCGKMMDVKTAFRNRFIEEEIYIDQLEGFTSVGEEQKVCHLQRSSEGGDLDEKLYPRVGVVPTIGELVVIFCDNNEAISQAKELRSHHRSKHIIGRYHLLREMVGRGAF
ncbi:UNVERIFIED_CONTAM: hypothetical protein Scaly_2748000 [Sesamum calycinum]|uniref:Uncharacterized protein n=1 Tax=Sesamum calycinum TaxID=2727403 RepID=A0AAW2J0R0_9LAMI